MANWTTLKKAIASVIKTNGNQEITGAVLQSTLNSIVNSIGENATFAGIATPTTNPGTPDGPVFYIATTAGSYSNFGGIKISQNELAILYKLSSSWSSYIIQLGTEVILDVSKRFPTGGIGGTDIYNIESAIAAVPGQLQLSVIYLVFKVSDTERELWQFNKRRTSSVSEFSVVSNWYKMRPSMYHEVEYKTNINSIRNSVPVSERISGLIIHYTTPEGEDKYEMYIGESNALNSNFWEKFIPIYVASDIDSLIQKSITPIYVDSKDGKFPNAIKELYLEKYEEGKQYIITRFSYNSSRPNGLIWVSYEGAPNDYSTVNNNNVGGIDGGIVTLESTDKSFKAHLIVDWSKIGYGINKDAKLYVLDSCKNMENSPSIYSKLSIEPIEYNASIGAGLETRLYNKIESTIFEDLSEQSGNENYSYNNIGLIHRASKQEKFNTAYVQLWRLSKQPITTGSLIVKSGFTISADGGTVVRRIDNFSSANLPQSGLYEIKLGKDVTLEEGEYLWVYYTGDGPSTTGSATIRVWSTNDTGSRCGMYFQGRESSYKYSTAFVLKQLKGDIVNIEERLSEVEEVLGTGGGDKISSPLITLPDDLYVAVGREQTFYYNEFIFGIESSQDNTLTNYNIEAIVTPSGLGNKCVSSKEGFTIYTYTQGNYTLVVSIYDQFNNLLVSKISTLHSFNAQSSTGKSILMLGASWIDINNGNRGYTPYLNEALKEMGITANFIGTRDAGTSGLKHEGIGGYTWKWFVSKPTNVKFKFFVDSMPSISTSDVYSNNGSTYKLIERGSNYLTLSRESGSTEPSGDTLTRVSGTGDESITFTSWTPGGSNPLWNTVTDELDFTHYRRDLCGLSTPLDVCNIQLGVNDCLGQLKVTEAEWAEVLTSVSTLLDAILTDSPNCKIIVNLTGLDSPSITGWSSLGGMDGDKKRRFQLNCYYMRVYINDLIKARDDYNTNVFIGQSILGINRWYGYGYEDRRYRYFKIDTDTMPQENLNKLKNFNFQQRNVYMYTEGGEEFIACGYDARGYLLCINEQKHSSWENHNQEFVNAQSVPQNTVPEAGNLTKGGGSSSVDFPVVPYTACYIENNNSKEHWFMNATHPYDLGYRQMAYCAAHQIASLL